MEMDDEHYSSDDDFDHYGFTTTSDVDVKLGLSSSSTSSSSSSVQVIPKESLLAAQREDLSTVMELLSLKEHNARTLLIHHCWNVERLTGVLVEKGRDHLFAAAGVPLLILKDCSLLTLSSTITCNVCFEDVSPDAASMMDCGHWFCNTCWMGHFIAKISDGQSKRIQCMDPKCNNICDEAIIRNLVSATNPRIADRFEHFLLESYIEDNNKVKWCPSVPHCGNAIRVDCDEQCCEVECTCGQQFCFNCLSEAHSPCTCLMWELWDKKSRNQSATVNWITENTKPCPKCHKHVEKKGGCNLVKCVCGQTFCWRCGKATGREHTWTRIIGHICQYEEHELKTSECTKYAQKRYIHHYNKYKWHLNSLELESKLRVKTQKKISILEGKHSKVINCNWVLNALDIIYRCRQVLAYSYPFAFYMFGNDLFGEEMTEEEKETKRCLFEDQQKQLEYNVERLLKILKLPFDEFPEAMLMQTRLDVINFSVLVDKICLKMYECIENDLLGSLFTVNKIAPYISKGVERASELYISSGSNSSPGSSMKSILLDVSPQQGSTLVTIGGAEHRRNNSSKHSLSTRLKERWFLIKRNRKNVNDGGPVDMPPADEG